MTNAKYVPLTITIVLLAIAPAFGDTINDLFGTGLGGPPYSQDPYYQLVSSPIGPGPAYSWNAFDGWAQPNPPWQWITPYNYENLAAPVGNYDYQTTFTLPSNFGNPLLAGLTAMDNCGTVYLNQHPILTITCPYGYFNAVPFSDSNPADFLAGVNTLDFVVYNAESTGPTGLLVENISGSYTATPEPGSFVLFGSGILGLVGVLRRKLS